MAPREAGSSRRKPDRGVDDFDPMPGATIGAGPRGTDRPDSQNSVRDSHKRMVAAANPLAAQAGREILASGGSAVDAAIAVQLVLNLVEPQSSGVGGGAFMVVWDGKSMTTLDGRETAPLPQNPSAFSAQTETDEVLRCRRRWLSVGVPGGVAVLETAHKRWGKLPWRQVIEPAVTLGGGRLYHLAASQRSAEPRRSTCRMILGACLFLRGRGKPKAVGAMLKNPALAKHCGSLPTRARMRFIPVRLLTMWSRR